MPLLPVPQPFSLELTTARFRAFGLDRATVWADGALYRAVGGRELRIGPADGGVEIDPLDAETEPVVRQLLGFEFDLVAFSAWASGEERLAPLEHFAPPLVLAHVVAAEHDGAGLAVFVTVASNAPFEGARGPVPNLDRILLCAELLALEYLAHVGPHHGPQFGREKRLDVILAEHFVPRPPVNALRFRVPFEDAVIRADDDNDTADRAHEVLQARVGR